MTNNSLIRNSAHNGPALFLGAFPKKTDRPQRGTKRKKSTNSDDSALPPVFCAFFVARFSLWRKASRRQALTLRISLMVYYGPISRENTGLRMRSSLLLKEYGLGQRWLQSIGLPPFFKSFGPTLLVALAYYLGARAAFLIGTLSDRIFAPFWPPNIILFCALLMVPKRRWWLYIAAALPSHLLAEITVAMPIAQSLVAFATNCMLAILSAVGVRWFLREPPWFGTLRNAAIYILITAGISPAIAALGGAFVQILGGGPVDYWTSWGQWWIANALGSVTLGPLFLVWFFPRPEFARIKSVRKTEGFVLILSLAVVCAIAFNVDKGTVQTEFLPVLLYSPLPVILWAAVRFGERGASAGILVVTVFSIWQNLRVSASAVFSGANPNTNVLALQIFLLGIAIPVFLLGAAIDELRRSVEATRRLAGALLQAQDEERRRIARELHDSTGQNLVMANLMAGQVETLAPPSCGPAIVQLKEILQGIISEIRTVSYLLHPPLLDVGGLGVALQSYANGFSKRTGIRVDLKLSPNVGRMSTDVELVLFRVIQEALTNIWRHSGSSTARIRLFRDVSDSRPRISLSIEDAGKGIPTQIRKSTLSRSSKHQVSSGLGLIAMRERLHQIGGQLEIHSIAGKTVIRANVMLNDETGRGA
jgi:signal transduction histidine kinase